MRTQHQITLTGEILKNEKFTVISFVPAEAVRLKENVWFKKLDSECTKRVDDYLGNLRSF